MDQKKIDESFIQDKGVFTPRSMVIRKKYQTKTSTRYKDGCVLISKSDFAYLLKMCNEAEDARFKQ